MLASSVPTESTVVRSTRCFVSSSRTPNCSTGRLPYCGSRNSATTRGLVICARWCRRLRDGPPPELDRGEHLRGAGGPMPPMRVQLVVPRARQARDAADRRESGLARSSALARG